MPDPLRSYTDQEEERLARQLFAITYEVHGGKLSEASFGTQLLLDLHRRLFQGVRAHAGKTRTADEGSEWLTFGPNRSVHRSEVVAQLQAVFQEAARSLRSFDAAPGARDYEINAIHLAVWLHAEIIRIHPFEDGNGRTSRLIANWTLIRLGLRPVAVETPKQEYRALLNHYFQTKDIQPLIDLYLRLMGDELDGLSVPR